MKKMINKEELLKSKEPTKAKKKKKKLLCVVNVNIQPK